MRHKIEQLVKKLRANVESAVSQSNNISRDLDYRRQDEINAKIQNALANDLQKILDEDQPTQTNEQIAISRGWVLEQFDSDGKYSDLWVSPDNKYFTVLPSEAYEE